MCSLYLAQIIHLLQVSRTIGGLDAAKALVPDEPEPRLGHHVFQRVFNHPNDEDHSIGGRTFRSYEVEPNCSKII